MVYSASSRISGQLAEPDPRAPRRAAARRRPHERARLRRRRARAARARPTCTSTTPNVSRKHAEVRPSGASWTVRDLGSTNGVKVNGRRIHGAQSLNDGDKITLGTSEIDLPAGETRDPRPRRRRPQVRLHRRALPLPALDGPLGAQGPAPDLGRRRRLRRPRRGARLRGRHRHARRLPGPERRRRPGRAAAARGERRRACATASPTTSRTARYWAAATRSTSSSRTRSPRPTTPACSLRGTSWCWRI